jgi:hypothetical protein
MHTTAPPTYLCPPRYLYIQYSRYIALTLVYVSIRIAVVDFPTLTIENLAHLKEGQQWNCFRRNITVFVYRICDCYIFISTINFVIWEIVITHLYIRVAHTYITPSVEYQTVLYRICRCRHVSWSRMVSIISRHIVYWTVSVHRTNVYRDHVYWTSDRSTSSEGKTSLMLL